MTEWDTDLDTGALELYLTAELRIDVAGIEELNDGLNLILEISTETGETYVLRRPNKLRHTSYINDLKQEYRVMQRLEDTAIEAPTPVLFCDDESLIGNSFFVMTALDGVTVPLGTDLPERFQSPESRDRVAELLIATLAEIHSLDVGSFTDVCDHQTPREQVVHATDRLDEVTRVTGCELSTLRSVGAWLQRNAPPDSKTTLVHGDFRPGNVLFAGTDPPEMTGVLDWETAMLGDPLTELGYLLLRWRDDGDPAPPLDELEARYSKRAALQQLKEVNRRGLSPFTNRPGSPSRRELVARYEDRTGLTFENERFYRAHAAFLLAMVWADLHRHYREAGAESDWVPWIEYLSMLADSIVRGEFQL